MPLRIIMQRQFLWMQINITIWILKKRLNSFRATAKSHGFSVSTALIRIIHLILLLNTWACMIQIKWNYPSSNRKSGIRNQATKNWIIDGLTTSRATLIYNPWPMTTDVRSLQHIMPWLPLLMINWGVSLPPSNNRDNLKRLCLCSCLTMAKCSATMACIWKALIFTKKHCAFHWYCTGLKGLNQAFNVTVWWS